MTGSGPKLISFDAYVVMLQKYLDETLRGVKFKITASGVSEYILIFSKPYNMMISLSAFYSDYFKSAKSEDKVTQYVALPISFSMIRDQVLLAFDEVVKGVRPYA